MLRRISAELLKAHEHLDLDADLVPVMAGPVRRYRLRYGTVDELDGVLRHRRALPMVVPSGFDLLLAVSAEADRVAVTDDVTVHVAHGGGPLPTVEVAGAETGAFLPGGLLLLVVPGPGMLLVDTATGRILDRAVVDVEEAVVSLTPHPHDGSVVLEAAMGDAGSLLYTVRAEGGLLTVERIGANVYAGGFRPAGDRLLLLPHPNAADEASVLSWPDRRPVASFTPEGDGVELGCFLDDDRILLKTAGADLLVCSADLRPEAWVDLDVDGEISIVLGLSADTIAVDVWDGDHPVPTVWWIHDRERHPAVTGTDDLSVRLARVATKLRLARELGGYGMFGADSHRFRLAPPLPEEEVAAFERAHGVTLPADYRAFVTRLGHGGPGGSPGAGPFYGIEALGDWSLGLHLNPSPQTLATPFPAVPGREDPGFWDRDGEPFTGTLAVAHQGCAHFSLLVVTGPARGRVTAYSDAPTGPTFTDDPDFLAWYERWLDAVLAGDKHF